MAQPKFQSPLGDFLYCQHRRIPYRGQILGFQSPLGDFLYCQWAFGDQSQAMGQHVSVPVRGFFILSG